MDEVLTREEIFRRYPEEWVLIAEPVLTADMDVVAGRVVFHSKYASEINERVLELRLPDAIVTFTSDDPEPDPDEIDVAFMAARFPGGSVAFRLGRF